MPKSDDEYLRLHTRRRVCYVILPRVFISHASVDLKFTEELMSRLKEQDIDCWMDSKQLQAGAPLRRGLEDAIRESDYFVLVHSPAYQKSEWCNKELDQAFYLQAQGLKPTIIPVIYEKADLGFLSSYLCADWKKDPNQAFQMVVEAIKGIASTRTVPQIAEAEDIVYKGVRDKRLLLDRRLETKSIRDHLAQLITQPHPAVLITGAYCEDSPEKMGLRTYEVDVKVLFELLRGSASTKTSTKFIEFAFPSDECDDYGHVKAQLLDSLFRDIAVTTAMERNPLHFGKLLREYGFVVAQCQLDVTERSIGTTKALDALLEFWTSLPKGHPYPPFLLLLHMTTGEKRGGFWPFKKADVCIPKGIQGTIDNFLDKDHKIVYLGLVEALEIDKWCAKYNPCAAKNPEISKAIKGDRKLPMKTIYGHTEEFVFQ